VRETVFNWLQFELADRRCLDLFAGSGAFGFEALSRGAAEVCFVESNAAAVQAIAAALQEFGARGGRVAHEDVFSFLAHRSGSPFDVVFLDPPYAEQCLGRACEALEKGGWLMPGAWIYLEDAAVRGEPTLPRGWTLLRSKKAGDVGYHLARRQTTD
jgi:RNA methyltransferase, RsmD family